jgi:predicted helicase
MPDEIIRQTYNLKDKSDWKLKDVREEIMKDDDWEQVITKILYRPFDEQWIFYHDALIERSRKEVMLHMLQENLALITHRREELDIPYTHFLATNLISEHGCLSTKTTNYHFPLYLYRQKDKDKPKKKSLSSMMMLFEPQAEYGAKKPNLSTAFIEKLTKEYGKSFVFDSSFLRRQESRGKELDSRFHGNDSKYIPPEEIFYYIYAVLYSNIYRTKYSEFLKIDFPRVPFTKDYKLFMKMAEYGERLVELHLLKSSEIDTPIARFQGEGNDKVEKLRYEKGKLYINNDQYFEGIPLEVWKYQVGGYQVGAKWLKDRKGKLLSVEETKHYCKIVTALKKTIEIQTKIDSTYLDIEKEIIDFSVT